mmetsp:Transcript_27703/g.108657  ORF Transcript_27703/g.108657 Transcript_27703/m.108657 type:complete len:148 (-) Transcript_27703:1032-1475(-)
MPKLKRSINVQGIYGFALGTCITVVVLYSGIWSLIHGEKPPTKEEMGRAYWTAIHSLAANLQVEATGADEQACNFIQAIAKLYPCLECREHFAQFVADNPLNCSSRNELLIWTCRAHNEVNKRNRKPLFPCDVSSLDGRWGSCGCEG